MFGISRREIEKRLKDKLIEELAESGHVGISGVGMLEYANGKIEFVASPSFIREVQTRRSVSAKGD